MKPVSATIDPNDVARFSEISGQWWDEHGPFAPLHRVNPARLSYIVSILCKEFGRNGKSLASLKGLKIVDVGCGGGLVCEPLARLGGIVTGLDADANAVAAARLHTDMTGLTLVYLNTTSDALAAQRAGQFDVVLALEIVEHVADVDMFVESCAALCRPGGVMVFSTLNKTLKSLALAKIAAEYILRWVPAGTHDWKKFMRPSTLAGVLRRHGAEPFDVTGLVFNPLQNNFGLSSTDLDVNYFIAARKPMP